MALLKKKRRVVRKRKTTVKRKRRVVTKKRRVARKKNPVRKTTVKRVVKRVVARKAKQYVIKKGASFFNGYGFTRTKANAARYSSLKTARTVARKLADALAAPVVIDEV